MAKRVAKQSRAKVKPKAKARPRLKAKPTTAKAKAKIKPKAKPKPKPAKAQIAKALAGGTWNAAADVSKPMVAAPTVIDGDAATAYSLPFHVHGSLANNEITLYRGTTRIDGHLALDFAGDDSPDGIIVDGDLEVTGTIVNRDGDNGPFLLVTGNVRAKNLIGGGSEIVVLGDLAVANVIFGFYNHGSITVHGTTRAKAIITEYHAFDLRGRVEGITISGRGDITDDDMFDSYAPALVPEVLTEGNPPGGYPDWDLTVQAILDGRPVLREGLTR